MLIATITILMGMLFGGGNMSAFVVEDFPKEVKANVDDKERQKEIISLVKPYEKEFKSVQKDLNKSKKKLKKLNLDRNASSEDINEILDEATTTWRRIQTEGLQTRSKTLEMLNDQEWEEIISKSLEEFDKKEVKKQEKAFKEFEKNFAKLQVYVEKEITDPERQEKIATIFTSFKKVMNNYVEANMNKTIKEMEAFADINASEEDLKAALSSIDLARDAFFDGILSLHFDLVDLTSDEEWTGISKAVNKIF